jgi:hypothetical protein
MSCVCKTVECVCKTERERRKGEEGVFEGEGEECALEK